MDQFVKGFIILSQAYNMLWTLYIIQTQTFINVHEFTIFSVALLKVHG